MDDASESEAVMLVDEQGRERQFNLHDAFELDGVDYYLVEAADEPEMVVVLREEGGALVAVEGEEFDRVMKMLESETE